MRITFAHNVQNRHKTLMETIEMERKFFPNCKIHVAYNGDDFKLDFFNDLSDIKLIKYIGNGHKIGCVNGCITSIQSALKDKTDIIIFSHDDVKINPAYLSVLKNHINNLKKNGVDIVCRRPISYGDNYYMMEGFLLKKSVASNIFKNKKLFSNENELPLDYRKSPSPEVWLYNVLNENNNNIQCIEYEQNNYNYNLILGENLGLFHKNAGLRGWYD